MVMLHDNGLHQSIQAYHDNNYCVYHMQWKHHTINNNKAVINISNITIQSAANHTIIVYLNNVNIWHNYGTNHPSYFHGLAVLV